MSDARNWLEESMDSTARYGTELVFLQLLSDEQRDIVAGTHILRLFCGLVPVDDDALAPCIETYARPKASLNAAHAEVVTRAPPGYCVGEVNVAASELGFKGAWFFAFNPLEPQKIVWFEKPALHNRQKHVLFATVLAR